MAAKEENQGFVWGQIYIVLSIVMGIIGIVYGSMALAATKGFATVPSPREMAISMVVISALQLLAGIGVWGRWVWGLWLTYLLFFLHLVGTTVFLILFLVYAPLGEIPVGITVGRIVVSVVTILLICLWWGYFIRRRRMFG